MAGECREARQLEPQSETGREAWQVSSAVIAAAALPLISCLSSLSLPVFVRNVLQANALMAALEREAENGERGDERGDSQSEKRRGRGQARDDGRMK